MDRALCLKARILREQGKANESAAIIRFINEYRNPDLYENLVKWFTETLDKNINACLESNTKADAKSWRLLKLESAIKYKEGGKFPVKDEELEKIIIEMIDILRTEK